MEHQAKGSKWVKSTFALKVYCLFLLLAIEVIAATLAHVGLFKDENKGDHIYQGNKKQHSAHMSICLAWDSLH
jgi:hypothetical protein